LDQYTIYFNPLTHNEISSIKRHLKSEFLSVYQFLMHDKGQENLPVSIFTNKH